MFSPEEVEFQKVMAARTALPVPPPAPFNADEQEQAGLITRAEARIEAPIHSTRHRMNRWRRFWFWLRRQR